MSDEPSGMSLLRGTFVPLQPTPVADEPSGVDLLRGQYNPSVAPKKKAADLTYDPDKTLGFVDQAKGSFAATDDQWRRMAAKSLYPNEDVEIAAKRFGKTTDGRMYHVGDDGVAYEVQPPKGWARMANVGEGVGPAIPAITGTVGGIASLPLGGVGSVAGAGVGAYAGDVVRQMIGNAIDDSPPQYNQTSALIEGVVGAAGQGLGNAVGKFATRLNPIDIGYYDQAATLDLLDKAAALGIRLTPAEATNMSSLVGEQKRLMSSPRAANDMGRFFDERNKEVMNAWGGFLDNIAPARDATALGRQTAAVADDILTDAQAARTAAVSPFYATAERQIIGVDPDPVVDFIRAQLPTAKGSEVTALRYALQQMMSRDADGAIIPGAVDTSFGGLNKAKMAIDAVLDDPELAAKVGIDRHAHRTLEAVRHRLVQVLDNAPGASTPGGPPGPYAAGRALYGVETERTVTPVQEILAPLLRVNASNSSIVRTAQAVLDPATRTPELVASARRMIEPRAPEVWQSIVRQFLQDHAYQALQENAKGTVSNVGGNIAKRIGNDAVEANMRAAMTPFQFNAYRDIVDVFRATGRALDANSDTAFKTEAIKNAKDAAGGWVARIIRNVNPAKLIENSADWFANANYERQAADIARIFAQGDHNAIKALRSLRQLSPDDVRRHIIIGHVLAKSGEYAVTPD